MAPMKALWWYYLSLWHYWVLGRSYASAPPPPAGTRFPGAARANVYLAARTLWLWRRPHYRSRSYQTDLAANLRNVALPGTGVALSGAAQSRAHAVGCLLVVAPAFAALAALARCWHRKMLRGAGEAFAEALLLPHGSWFSTWQANCRLAALHALVTDDGGYALEDKLMFLERARDAGLPVSPWLEAPATLVAKRRDEEGGLGYLALENAPPCAPLSTLRVVTCDGAGRPSALSCVWRAGRAGRRTDHHSVLFDVCRETGRISAAATSAHWYHVGRPLYGAFPDGCLGHTLEAHPDTGRVLSGETIAAAPDAVSLCETAHANLCPATPLVGWDVALTPAGAVLLEGNFSCNLFRPRTWAAETYAETLDSHAAKLDALFRRGFWADAST